MSDYETTCLQMKILFLAGGLNRKQILKFHAYECKFTMSFIPSQKLGKSLDQDL